MSSSTNGTVTKVEIAREGGVYVGGAFSVIGTITANYIAYWNGADWEALGSGLTLPS